MIKQLAAKDIKSYLMAEPSSVLLDVRTNEEWETIGKPEGEKIGIKTYFLSIQFGKERIFNENFIQEFKNLAINQDKNILILCRSGVRSQFAAELLNKEKNIHVLIFLMVLKVIRKISVGKSVVYHVKKQFKG